MINVTAQFAVREDKIDEFESVIAAARPHMLADEGCLRYDLQRVHQSETEYVLLEAYDSGDALRRHGELQAYKDMARDMAGLVAADPVVTVLRPVGEQAG